MTNPMDVSGKPAGAEGSREPYEAPRLMAVGNARDLLAGFEGSTADACPCPGHDFMPNP
jgi:hypothetical protein